jgi:Flp pilus assembly protein TadG
MRLRFLKGFFAAESGAALVEAAVILPVFLTLVGGVYEFGFFLYQEQLVTSGVRDAARYLSLTADPTSITNQSNAKNLAVSGSISGGTPRVAGWATSDVSVSINSIDNTAGSYGGGSVVQVVTVSTSFVGHTLGFLDLLGLKSPTISAYHQERCTSGSAQAQG